MAAPPEPEPNPEELYIYNDPGPIPEMSNVNEIISDNEPLKKALRGLGIGIGILVFIMIIINKFFYKRDTISGTIIVGVIVTVIVTAPFITAYLIENSADLKDDESVNILYNRRIIQKVVYSILFLVFSLVIFGNILIGPLVGPLGYNIGFLLPLPTPLLIILPIMIISSLSFFIPYFVSEIREPENINKFGIPIVLLIYIIFFLVVSKSVGKQNEKFIILTITVFLILSALSTYLAIKEDYNKDANYSFILPNNITSTDNNCHNILYDKSIINWDNKRVSITFDVVLNSLNESKTLISCGDDWEIKFDKPNESINLIYKGVEQVLSIPLTADNIVTTTSGGGHTDDADIAHSKCFIRCGIVDGKYTGGVCIEGDKLCEDESKLIQSMNDNVVYVHCPDNEGCVDVKDPIIVKPNIENTISITMTVNTHDDGSGTLTLYDKLGNENKQSACLESMITPPKWSKELNVLNYKTIKNLRYCQYSLTNKNSTTTLILISIITTLGILTIIHPKVRSGLFGSKLVSFDVSRAYHGLMH